MNMNQGYEKPQNLQPQYQNQGNQTSQTSKPQNMSQSYNVGMGNNQVLNPNNP